MRACERVRMCERCACVFGMCVPLLGGPAIYLPSAAGQSEWVCVRV